MARRSSLLLVSSAALLIPVACSATGSSLDVGADGTGGASGYPPGSGGTTVLHVGDSGTSTDLNAHIESPPGVTVEFITLTCNTACADVQAVVHGGYAPYTLSWEDGSTDPFRHVCPSESTAYALTVTDSGSMAGEFPRAPETVHASVTANVIRCVDGGAPHPDAGVPVTDSGPPLPGDPICIKNPSFEGTPRAAVYTASPWSSCGVLPTDNNWIWDDSMYPGQTVQLAPTDGTTYLETSTNGGVGTQGATQPLCSPLLAGRTYSLTMDLASPLQRNQVTGVAVSSPTLLQLWGGNDACARTELLWTSPSPAESWATYCATFTPKADAVYLTLVALDPPNSPIMGSWLTVDHLVAVEACPGRI